MFDVEFGQIAKNRMKQSPSWSDNWRSFVRIKMDVYKTKVQTDKELRALVAILKVCGRNVQKVQPGSLRRLQTKFAKALNINLSTLKLQVWYENYFLNQRGSLGPQSKLKLLTVSVFLGVIGGLTIPPGTVSRVSEERDRVRPRLFSDSAPKNVTRVKT